MVGHKICFIDKCDLVSLNYPCYTFSSGALADDTSGVWEHCLHVFSTILTKGNNFCDFLFAFTDNKTLLKTSSGPGCSKLMTSLVNVSLKFQT